MKAIIFDTETTGIALPSDVPIERQPRIIEIGCVLVENSGELETINELVDPGVPITDEITKITGITQADVKGKPTFAGVYQTLKEAFASAPLVIGHNLVFDMRMIEIELLLGGFSDFKWPDVRMCTVNEYYADFGRRMKLSELYEVKLGKPLVNAHRAVNDAMAVYDILKHDRFF